MLELYLDIFSPSWLVLYFVLSILTLNSFQGIINISFFAFLTVIFFSLDESVWQFAKYRLEVLIPLIAAQGVLVARIYAAKYASLILIGSIYFVFVNLGGLYGFPSTCAKGPGQLENDSLHYRLEHGCNYNVRVPFYFKEVLSGLRDGESLGETYIPGVYYGSFIHVLGGATVDEYLDAQKIWERQDEYNSRQNHGRFGASPSSIDSDTEINFVVLGFMKDFDEVREGLLAYGWKHVSWELDKAYGTSVVLMRREVEHTHQ